MDDTLTEAQGRSLQSAVEAVPNVRSVRFITREEACETFEKKYEGKYALGDVWTRRSCATALPLR